MDNNYNNPNNQFWNNYIKRDNEFSEVKLSQQKEPSKNKRDEDLIIEENTIYEIDRNCVERLKKNRRRLI